MKSGKRFQLKHLTDAQVVSAVVRARLAELHEYPYQLLARETGIPERVCFKAMERADDRGFLEYGVSLRTAWPTEEGLALVSPEEAEAYRAHSKAGRLIAASRLPRVKGDV